MNFNQSFNNALNRPILNADKPYLVVDILNNNKVIKQYKRLSNSIRALN